MRYVSLLAAILITSISNAQQLKLRKGQKFTYEYLSQNSSVSSTKYSSTNYSSYGFEVTSAKNNKYIVKMQPLRVLKFNSVDKRIVDTQHPDNKLKDIFTLTDQILTKATLILEIDSSRKVVKTSGFENLAKQINEQALAEKLPENIYGGNNKEFVQYATNPDIFIRIARLAFSQQEKDGSSGSAQVKKQTLIDHASGVSKLIAFDSVASGLDSGKTTKFENREMWRLALKSSSLPNVKSATDLLEEFSNQTDLKNYYLPSKMRAREAQALHDWYGDHKGKLGIEEIARHKIDSLSKLAKEDDYEFQVAAAKVFSWFDYEAKLKIIEKIPVRYFDNDTQLGDKARLAYEKRNTEDFVDILKVMFTDFSANGDYPLNVNHVVSVVQNYISKDVHDKATSEADLLKIKDMVQQVDNLKLPLLSGLFDGLKPYIDARLAIQPQDVIKLADQRFNSLLGNYGRYRLLIYDKMTELKVPDSIRTAYLDYTIDMFRNDIELYSKPPAEDYLAQHRYRFMISPRRLVLSKHIADAYYRKIELDPKNKIKYLQIASDYAPSQEDKVENNYAADREYHYFPKLDYTELYLNEAGIAAGATEELLKKYVDMVILEPNRYPTLKEKYLKAYPRGDFKSFFSKALQEKLPKTPAYALKERKGMEVKNTDSKGKFTFIDFWGTWCGACVAEIDKIEDLYVNNPVPEKLNVTTIACYDKKTLVDEFMEKKGFKYQVLMSDDKIEKQFKVQSYPTKLLLLPNNVYLAIGFRDDYRAILKRYTEWEL